MFLSRLIVAALIDIIVFGHERRLCGQFRFYQREQQRVGFQHLKWRIDAALKISLALSPE